MSQEHKQLLAQFCSPGLSLQLIDIGFDKNQCFIELDGFECPRHKFSSTNGGDYIKWDLKYDNNVPLILYQQAIEFLSTNHNLNIETPMGKDEDYVWYDWNIESTILVKNYSTDFEPLASSESGLNTRQQAQHAAIEKCVEIIRSKNT